MKKNKTNQFPRDYELAILIKAIHNLKDYKRLQIIFEKEHPLDVAKTLERLNYNERFKLYKVLSDEKLADVFEYVDEEIAPKYLRELDSSRSVSVISKMETDDAADLIQELEDDEGETYLKSMSNAKKRQLENLVGYLEGTAGALMSTSFIKIPSGVDIKEAMNILIKRTDNVETIDPLFICKDDILVGTVKLKDLIIARSPLVIDEIMNKNFMAIDPNEKLQMATEIISTYDIYALPVIEQNKLIGIITIDDAAEEIVNSSEAKYHMMASAGGNTRNAFISNIIHRLPWLIILLALSVIVANIVGIFESVISQVTILVFFQTMILDMGGNVGTQSLAVTIRSISKHSLDSKKAVLKHLFSELKIGVINGILLSALAFVVTYIFLLIKSPDSAININVSLTISLAMFLSLIASEIIGALLPIILNKLKIDPAVASGPFITTLNDIISIVIYFGLSTLLLGIVI